MEAAVNYAALLLSILPSAYRFPNKNMQLDMPQILVNLALIIAACVIFAQIFSHLFILSDRFKDGLLLSEMIAMFIAAVVLIVAFVLKSMEKSGGSFCQMPLHLKGNVILLFLPFAGAGVVKCYGYRFIFEEWVLKGIRNMRNNPVETIAVVCFFVIDLILVIKKRPVAAFILFLIPLVVKGTFSLMIAVFKLIWPPPENL